jgi:predicted ATPase
MLREVATRPASLEACTAHRLNGNAHWLAGDFTAARVELERALALFDVERDSDLVVRFAQDVGVAAKTYLALTLWPMGQVEHAQRVTDEALARAQRIGHAGTAAYVRSHCATLEMIRGNPAAVAAHAEALLDISGAHEMPMFAAYGAVNAAWARARMGGGDAAIAEMRAAIEMCRQRGIGLNMPILTTVLAEAEALAGDMNAGLETIELALAATERQGERWFAAETNRIRGEILLKRDLGDTAPAEEAYRTAIAIAQQQKAQSFELRAAVSLARLWRDQGKPRQARELLAPVDGWFTEGLDTPDLKEAQALLDELHA